MAITFFHRAQTAGAGKRGFALLIAVIFMSVMLTFGLTLAALGYKQQVLASAAAQSQVAFYAADAALECVLYAEQRTGVIAYNSDPDSPVPIFKCDGQDPYITPTRTYAGSGLSAKEILTYRFALDSGKHCADVTVYRPAPTASQSFYTFSQGYDTSCDTVAAPDGSRFASRGLDVRIIDPTAPLSTSCTLTAFPQTISTGGSLQLTWTTSNATSFSIDHGLGAMTPVASGNVSVSPTSDTTYEGTATGISGTVNCSDTVLVTVPQKRAFVSATAGTLWTVPAGVTSITVKAWGAGGGGGGDNANGPQCQPGPGCGTTIFDQGNGGGGGFAQTTLAVTPGETLTVRVGGGGAYYIDYGGGGGGYSGLFRSSTPLLIAGGGGGGGGDYANTAGGDGGGGGPGTGSAGHAGQSGYGAVSGGGGGTQSAGGAAGTGGWNNGVAGASLAGGAGAGYDGDGNGAAGGINGGAGGGNYTSGGGGGAGYFGGGGGGKAASATNGGGGGGGSNYVTGTGTVSTGAGVSRTAANASDGDYVGSAGQGGAGAYDYSPVAAHTNNGSAGSDGLVVITW